MRDWLAEQMLLFIVLDDILLASSSIIFHCCCFCSVILMSLLFFPLVFLFFFSEIFRYRLITIVGLQFSYTKNKSLGFCAKCFLSAHREHYICPTGEVNQAALDTLVDSLDCGIASL